MSLEAAIREKLASLAPESMELLDESGQHIGHAGAKSGSHFQLIIVSQVFADVPLQTRHRMVYKALDTLMNNQIHALSIKAFAPNEI